MTDDKRIKFTDSELLYAATQRCRCGAGLAYPLDHKDAMAIGAWVCSAVLKGDGIAHDQSLSGFDRSIPRPGEHDSLPWAFFKVREETSINNRGGPTTRPAGTIARTVGTAKCAKCGHEWKSDPYSACDTSHHWFAGPCPGCGNIAGTYDDSGRYRNGIDDTGRCLSDGPPKIETRFSNVVLTAEGAQVAS